MQDSNALVASLQLCVDLLSPLSHPAHKTRLVALMRVLQEEDEASRKEFLQQIVLSDYVYTVSVCRSLLQNDPKHAEHLTQVEQFLRERTDDNRT